MKEKLSDRLFKWTYKIKQLIPKPIFDSLLLLVQDATSIEIENRRLKSELKTALEERDMYLESFRRECE